MGLVERACVGRGLSMRTPGRAISNKTIRVRMRWSRKGSQPDEVEEMECVVEGDGEIVDRRQICTRNGLIYPAPWSLLPTPTMCHFGWGGYVTAPTWAGTCHFDSHLDRQPFGLGHLDSGILDSHLDSNVGIYFNRQADRQTGRQVDRETSRQAHRHTGTQVDLQKGRQVGR